ncbi:protein AUXIN RESPONSE 4-like [Triticum dicoccoides]|uniref:protein AUXIN RESPONSE 4-like n=1 Tax=Triticum dicoccoides TaxID=85692 RepID=UPI001890D73E|nr:protein AUXIN RESPONSE 4-like [Triticum dicoccoides]
MTDDPAAAGTGRGAPPPPPARPPRPLSVVPALPFWFYLTAAVSLLALVLPHLLSPHASPPLPPLLRRHLSDGRLLKLHPGPDLFAFTSRPAAHSARHHPVLVLPGLAAGSFSFRRILSSLSSHGLVAAAVDLPGQGLSPPPAAPPPRTNPLREIMDRGIFHAFEHLVETGEVPFQETAPEPSRSFYAASEAAAAVARSVDALGLAPVHLVLHDSALAAGAAFVSANPAAVQSVTLIDATATLPAFPAAVLGVPALGRLVLRVPALFKGLMRLSCSRGVDAEEADALRAAMRGQGKRDAVFEAWKAMNQSFDLAEWRSSSEEVKRLPMMVLWSGSWSDMWIDEGKKVTKALPDAKFIYHYGGRWPQVDAYEEISKLIADFVTMLPTTATEHLSQNMDQSSDEPADAHSDHPAL